MLKSKILLVLSAFIFISSSITHTAEYLPKFVQTLDSKTKRRMAYVGAAAMVGGVLVRAYCWYKEKRRRFEEDQSAQQLMGESVEATNADGSTGLEYSSFIGERTERGTKKGGNLSRKVKEGLQAERGRIAAEAATAGERVSDEDDNNGEGPSEEQVIGTIMGSASQAGPASAAQDPRQAAINRMQDENDAAIAGNLVKQELPTSKLGDGPKPADAVGSEFAAAVATATAQSDARTEPTQADPESGSVRSRAAMFRARELEANKVPEIQHVPPRPDAASVVRASQKAQEAAAATPAPDVPQKSEDERWKEFLADPKKKAVKPSALQLLGQGRSKTDIMKQFGY